MYLYKMLLVLALMPLALVIRPLFYITVLGDGILRDPKNIVGLPITILAVLLSTPLVLYASLGLLRHTSLGNQDIRNIFVELFTGAG